MKGGIMKIDEYVTYDALGLAELVAKGEVTAAELQGVACEAAEQVNDQLNAVVGFVDHQYDGELAEDARFAGVPTFLKDLGAGIAGLPQEMGSRLTSGFVNRKTSHFAEQMLKAEDFGLQSLKEEEIAGGGSIESSAEILLNILSGKGTAPQEQVVCANAGMAIATSRNLAPKEGFELAKEAIRSGNALASFRKLQELSKNFQK